MLLERPYESRFDSCSAGFFHTLCTTGVVTVGVLAGIGVGDLVFIKSFPPSRGLYIKAVGIVKTHEVIDFTDIPSLRDLGYGREVDWIWHDNVDPVHLGRLEDRYDYMRGGTLFQEFGPVVQARVIDIVLNGQPAEV